MAGTKGTATTWEGYSQDSVFRESQVSTGTEGEGHVQEWIEELGDFSDDKSWIPEGKKEELQKLVAVRRGQMRGYAEHCLGVTDMIKDRGA